MTPSIDYSLSCVSTTISSVPTSLLLFFVATTLLGLSVFIYVAVWLVAPVPRPPVQSEKQFVHIDENAKVSKTSQLPCWQDRWGAAKEARQRDGDPTQSGIEIAPPEVYMSLVIPAYNEEQRLGTMLKEAVEYLEQAYPFDAKKPAGSGKKGQQTNGHATKPGAGARAEPKGWEVLLVSDGSTDKTVDVALDFARKLQPTSPRAASAIRVVELAHNRGKGGAVVHGLRHVRGAYALFADADGATTFADLGQLVPACEAAAHSDGAATSDGDGHGHGRGMAIGSRAHLVGSAAVVQRSFLRNLLMHSFHLFLRLLTPPATARIRDTQCGFKLFSRSALPFIVPYMHSEGWIFDVEMLMLAESAAIPVAEVPVGWHEVTGSKLNVIRDSLAMAFGLAILRVAWGIGVYRRW